ncbi:hypothetical protein BBJ28_00024093, partial [Nothophytophthora sp. Chile5]
MGGAMPSPSAAPQPASYAAPYTLTPGAQPLLGMAAGYCTPGTLVSSPTTQPGNMPYGSPQTVGGMPTDCNVPAPGQGTIRNPGGVTAPAGTVTTTMGNPPRPSGHPVTTYAASPPAAGQAQVNYGVPLAVIGQAPATFDPRLAPGGATPGNYGTPYVLGANVLGYPGGTPVSSGMVPGETPPPLIVGSKEPKTVVLERKDAIRSEGLSERSKKEESKVEGPILNPATAPRHSALETLATTAEAQRAGRNFRRSVPDVPLASGDPTVSTPKRDVVLPPVAGVASVLSDGLSEDKSPSPGERSPAEVESTVIENVTVSLSENSEAGEAQTFVCALRGFGDRAFPGEASPALKRSLARQVLYQQLSERFLPDSDTVDVPMCEMTFPSKDVAATEDGEPFRDKVPELDLERARAWVLNAPCGTIIRESDLEDVMQMVKEYHSQNLSSVWGTLRRRRTRPRSPSAGPVSRKRQRHVCFDCSSLFPGRSEALTSLSSRPEEEDDLSHYVSVVRPEEDGEERPTVSRPGLQESFPEDASGEG